MECELLDLNLFLSKMIDFGILDTQLITQSSWHSLLSSVYSLTKPTIRPKNLMRNFLRFFHPWGWAIFDCCHKGGKRVARVAGRGLPGLLAVVVKQLAKRHDFYGTCWNSGFIELSFVETWKHKAARNYGSCFIICLPGRPPSSQTRRALGMIFFSQNQILIYKKNIKELSRPFRDNTYIGFHIDYSLMYMDSWASDVTLTISV